MRLNIRRLPDFPGVAKDVSEMLDPDECRAGETVVRRGHINHHELGPVECVTAHCQDEGTFSIYVITRRKDQWVLSKGLATPSQRIQDAITSVLGSFPPELVF